MKKIAKYTYELRDLVNEGFTLNLTAYPIFDETYRESLNEKIIAHFYFREIGQETPDRFNYMLARRMNEIMPYYNQLYKSEAMAANIDPLSTDKLAMTYVEERDKGTDETTGTVGKQTGAATEDSTTTETGEANSTGEHTKSTSHNTDNIFSDVPSSQLPTSLQNGYYTTRNITTDSGSEDSTDTVKNTTTQTDTVDASRTMTVDTKNDLTRKETVNDDVTGTRTVTGYTGHSTAVLIAKYRDLFVNIDLKILDDLEILFMGVY